MEEVAEVCKEYDVGMWKTTVIVVCLGTEYTEEALRRMEVSHPTDTQSCDSQLYWKQEELELELELAEALGWQNAAMEAGFMRLAGGSVLGSSTVGGAKSTKALSGQNLYAGSASEQCGRGHH